jgi:hypothetical protein
MKYYQPEYNEKVWDEKDFHSWFIFHDKKRAEEAFPGIKILELENNDIEKVLNYFKDYDGEMRKIYLAWDGYDGVSLKYYLTRK